MNATEQTVVVLRWRGSTRKIIGKGAVAPSEAGRAEMVMPGLLHGNLAAIRAQMDYCLALWGETNPTDD